jgi:hypothetical protein
VAKILLDSEVEGKCELGSWVLMRITFTHSSGRGWICPKLSRGSKPAARATPTASSAVPVAHSGRGIISTDGFGAGSTKRRLQHTSNKTRSMPAFARLPRHGGGPAPGPLEIERGCHRVSLTALPSAEPPVSPAPHTLPSP